MERKSYLILVVAGLAAVLLLAACGPQTAEISVDMTEFAFEPTSWTVPAGAEVTITMNNEGGLEHEWVIMEQGYQVEGQFTDEDEGHIFWEGEVEAGESQTFTFTAPSEPGTYQVVCGIEPHFEQGMIGTLTVE